MSEQILTATERTTHRRRKERGHHDRATIDRILDEGLVCHLGFVARGQPYVIPTGYARLGDQLILHGAVASRAMQAVAGGLEVCVTVTLLDGLVLARSAFHHSMNYRSVMVFGRARRLTDEAAKRRALDALVEHLIPGRGRDARPPSAQELAATEVLALPLTEASAKVRVGPPVDTERDQALPVWAGVVPLAVTPGPPLPAPDLAPGLATPPYAERYLRPATD